MLPNSLGRNERLKSRTIIGNLFRDGKALSAFPIRLVYLIESSENGAVQAAFSVSTRNFKKATDRNRIKRLMREVYRTQKHPLQELVVSNKQQLSIFFIYTGKELPDFELIKIKTVTVIELLIKKISSQKINSADK
ncbi:MAG: ribonuclease P protein component [Chitinophagaceae bacterium]|nr:ribonuclease P protein component [Chitinophagaceae bacterium]